MKARHVVLVGLAIMVGACGNTKPPVTTTSTTAGTTSTTLSASTTSTPPPSSISPTSISSTSAAREYLAAASVADVAYSTWKAELKGLTEVSQAVGPCRTYATELTTFDNAVMRIVVTGKVSTDIRTLVSDDRVVIQDLQSVSTQTVASLKKAAAQLEATGLSAVSAGDVVRADLGLAPS